MKGLSRIHALLISTIFLSASVHSTEVEWYEKPVHKIDIDCDGLEDSVYIGHIKNTFK